MIKVGTFRLVLILLGLTASLSSKAQLSANFTASPTSGCAPIVVNFTDASTGGATSWSWDLGNGTLSTNQNPSTSYLQPGTYTIRLTVSNGSQSNTKTVTNYITVYAPPVISFRASDSTPSCAPKGVVFTSTIANGVAGSVQYAWDFGDGATSTAPNPAHTYTNAGVYNVTLVATNAAGCVNSLTKPGYISTAVKPTAGFSFSGNAPCSLLAQVTFTNTSSNASTYSWSFGDGGTSTAASPTHTYIQPGTYPVRLIARVSAGCADTILQNVSVTNNQITANFNAPASACAGSTVNFTNTSTPVPTASSWDFGDGTTSTSLNPSKIYSTPGTYTISLTVSNNGCTSVKTQTITINPNPTAAFTANPSSGCSAPLTVSFTNTSSGATSYLWNFGDGSTTVTTSSPSHTYANYGSYPVTLTATNAAGCTATSAPVTIQSTAPTLTVVVSGSRCVPATLSFSGTVIPVQPGVPSVQWQFGDGTSATTTGLTTTHTYASAGSYTLTATATLPSGCIATHTQTILVGTKPTASFTAAPLQVCTNQPVTFANTSTGATSYSWNFGDGGTSTNANPTHMYGASGTYSVTVYATNNGCTDTFTRSNYLTITGPTAQFIPFNTCTNKLAVSFTNTSTNATSYLWDFGDGTTSTAVAPSHNYASYGRYTIKLTAYNGSCQSESIFIWRLLNTDSFFTATPATICRGGTVNFSMRNTAGAQTVTWAFGDGTGTNPIAAGSIAHPYAANGSYDVTLSVTDSLGCVETLTRTALVMVRGVTAAFDGNPKNPCAPGGVSFIDQSNTGGSTINSRTWTFGDGTSLSGNNPAPSHTYTSLGNYTVSLVVTDTYGCRDSLTKINFIQPLNPAAAFQTADTLHCVGENITFNNQSSNAVSSQWDFGDGTTATSASPVKAYTTPGNYTVRLIVTAPGGCKDTLTRVAYARVINRVASFTVSDSVASCPPLVVQVAPGPAPAGTQYNWSFGNGSTSVNPTPSTIYTYPGIYTIQLIAVTPAGCRDTFRRTVRINGPTGTVSYTPVTGCAPLTVQFTVNAQSTISYTFDYDNGNTFTTASNTASHTYGQGSVRVPKVILSNGAGCQVAIMGPDSIRVNKVQAGFTTNRDTVCLGNTISFTDTSRATFNGITTRTWAFGDNTSSTLPNPVKNYTQAGTYTVRLIAQSGACADTALRTVVVNPRPQLVITGGGNLCSGKSTTLSATGATTYQWSPATGLSCTTCANPTATPATTTTYTVIGSNPSGCRDTVQVTVTVQAKPTVNAGPDTAVCAGKSVGLLASGTNTYQWSPAVGLSCTTCANPTATPATTTTYTVIGSNAFGCSDIDQIVVTVRPKPVVRTGADTAICFGNAVALQVTGATTYQWSPAAGLSCTTCANPVATPTLPTTYTVVGINAGGCSDTDAIVITVNPKPTVNAGPDVTLCSGKSTTLLASGATTYQWSPATGLSCTTCANPVATPTTTTTYTVVGSNASGCRDTDQVLITVNPAVVQTVGPGGTRCAGSPITLSASGATTYQWSPAAGLSCTTCANPVATPTTTTTYTVIGSNAFGCSDTDQVTVSINPAVIQTVTPNSTRCAGSPITLSATGATDYQWSPATGLSCTTCASPVATPTTTTTYTVIGSNASGCRDTDLVTLTINPAVVQTVGPGGTRCAGTPITLSASGAATYQWSPSTGLSCTTCASPVATPTITTTYTVIGSNAFGCSDTDQVTVIINPLPVVSAGNNPVICGGTSVQLNATGAVSYQWSPATALSCTTCANPTASPAVTTTYTVTGTSAAGCTASSSATVYVNTNPVITVGPPQSICAGQSATLSVTGASGYVWSPSGSLNCSNCANPVATPLATTTYTVIGGQNSCLDTATVTITVNPLPVLTIQPARTTICLGQAISLNVSGANSYQWNPATGLSCTTCANPTANPTLTTVYQVTGTSTAGCTATAQATVLVNPTLNVTASAADTSICEGSSTQLTAMGASTYQWSPATGLSCTTCASPVATPTNSTTYRVIGSGVASCDDTAYVTVTVRPKPTLNVSPATAAVCAGDSVLLAVSGTPATYSWSPATGLSCTTCANPTAMPTATTTYTVTATAVNGCVDRTTTTVTVNPLPVVSAGPDRAICANTPVTLTATGAATYVWSPATGLNCTTCANPTVTLNGSASYVVTGTDNNGCRASDSIVLTITPRGPVSVSASDTICLGSSLQLEATGGTSYRWFPESGLSSPAIANPTASPAQTTTYFVAIQQNGCYGDTLSVTVTVAPLPRVDAGPDMTIVAGESLTLSGKVSEDVTTYFWTPGDYLSCTSCLNPVATPKAAITYALHGVNKAGCESTDAVALRTRCETGQFFVPNTFTPNGDGQNDVFYPRGKGIAQIKLFRVFNRWGEVVFEVTNFSVNDERVAWDGTFKNNPLKPDTYVWMIDAICDTGDPLTLKGDVSIIK